MKKTAFVLIAIVLAAVVAVAGCVSTPAEESTQSPAGIWCNNGNIVCFNPDGSVTAVAGNTYKGTYTVTESGIVIKDLAAVTKMAVSEEEKAFIAALTSATGCKIVNSDLVLTADGKDVLTLKKGIVGTWTTEDGITITFNKDNTFNGMTAANSFFGTYQFTANGIEITREGSTLALGTDEEMAAEKAFFDALAATKNNIVNKNKFTLVDGEGKDLVTLTATPVGTWTNNVVTLELAADGTATIVADNTFKAAYEFADHTIVIKDVVQLTKMPQTEEEQAFFTALESAENTFKVSQFLTAYDAEGNVVLMFLFA